jgi:hypothetical protein
LSQAGFDGVGLDDSRHDRRDSHAVRAAGEGEALPEGWDGTSTRFKSTIIRLITCNIDSAT